MSEQPLSTSDSPSEPLELAGAVLLPQAKIMQKLENHENDQCKTINIPKGILIIPSPRGRNGGI